MTAVRCLTYHTLDSSSRKNKTRSNTRRYVDRHLVHEVTSPQAFEGLERAGLQVRCVDRTLVTADHNVPTTKRERSGGVQAIEDEESRIQVATLEKNVKKFGLKYFGLDDSRQGIVHIVGPEQGFTLPGMTLVCGDSHTATHGAFGALAFGIGTTEVEHVLATQTILQKPAKNMRVTVRGERLPLGVVSKDLALHLCGAIGTGGGTGHVIEYAGKPIEQLSMEARMSICNMAIEAGARAGMIAPDEITYRYLKGRPMAPKGETWDRAVKYWSQLPSDEGATYVVVFERCACSSQNQLTHTQQKIQVRYGNRNRCRLYCTSSNLGHITRRCSRCEQCRTEFREYT